MTTREEPTDSVNTLECQVGLNYWIDWLGRENPPIKIGEPFKCENKDFITKEVNQILENAGALIDIIDDGEEVWHGIELGIQPVCALLWSWKVGQETVEYYSWNLDESLCVDENGRPVPEVVIDRAGWEVVLGFRPTKDVRIINGELVLSDNEDSDWIGMGD